MMKRIYSDYLRIHGLSALAQTGCSVLVTLGMNMAGIFEHSTLRYIGIAALLLIYCSALWSIASSFVIAPLMLKKQVLSLSEQERKSLYEEYDSAKQVCAHRYMKSCFLFYSNRLIYIFRYKDITALTKKAKHLVVHSDRKKAVTMPFQSVGANAMAAAYIKSFNTDIKFSAQTDI